MTNKYSIRITVNYPTKEDNFTVFEKDAKAVGAAINQIVSGLTSAMSFVFVVVPIR